MAGLWSELNERSISLALSKQAKAIAEIRKGFGPYEEDPIVMVNEQLFKEAEACGHRWGVPCECALCQRNRVMIQGVIDQLVNGAV